MANGDAKSNQMVVTGKAIFFEFAMFGILPTICACRSPSRRPHCFARRWSVRRWRVNSYSMAEPAIRRS